MFTGIPERSCILTVHVSLPRTLLIASTMAAMSQSTLSLRGQSVDVSVPVTPPSSPAPSANVDVNVNAVDTIDTSADTDANANDVASAAASAVDSTATNADASSETHRSFTVWTSNGVEIITDKPYPVQKCGDSECRFPYCCPGASWHSCCSWQHCHPGCCETCCDFEVCDGDC